MKKSGLTIENIILQRSFRNSVKSIFGEVSFSGGNLGNFKIRLLKIRLNHRFQKLVETLIVNTKTYFCSIKGTKNSVILVISTEPWLPMYCHMSLFGLTNLLADAVLKSIGFREEDVCHAPVAALIHPKYTQKNLKVKKVLICLKKLQKN